MAQFQLLGVKWVRHNRRTLKLVLKDDLFGTSWLTEWRKENAKDFPFEDDDFQGVTLIHPNPEDIGHYTANKQNKSTPRIPSLFRFTPINYSSLDVLYSEVAESMNCGLTKIYARSQLLSNHLSVPVQPVKRFYLFSLNVIYC